MIWPTNPMTSQGSGGASMARAASAREPAPVGGAASATPCCCSGLVRRVPQGGLIGQKLFKCRWIRAVCVPTIPAPMRLSCVTPIHAPMRCFCLTKVFGAVASVSPVSQSCDRASAPNQQKCTSHKNKKVHSNASAALALHNSERAA